MPRLLALILLLQAFLIGAVEAKQAHLELVVTRPYLEMHTGPGRGFPVFYVVGRGEIVTVLYSRTDWYRVRAARGEEGWVRRDDLAATTLESGDPAPIPPYPDFSAHRWELGAAYGVYNRENLVSGYLDFGLTDSLDVELALQQAFGTIDTRDIATLGLRNTIVPEWKWISPTAGIGFGYQSITDNAPPAPLEAHNQLAYASLGARGFITRRFMWRFDWRAYYVFNQLNKSEVLEEWKFGLAVFF
ncbi:MAG: SH3 domain-containing protein [Steroidobacteraceae bacterium]|jgi:SH3 domain-containing protein